MLESLKYYSIVLLPVTIVQIVAAYVSWKLNVAKDNFWFCISWLLAAIPTWQIVARMSTNLVFDGIIFDIALITAYTFSILTFTQSWDTLKPANLAGLIIILIGLILFKK